MQELKVKSASGAIASKGLKAATVLEHEIACVVSAFDDGITGYEVSKLATDKTFGCVLHCPRSQVYNAARRLSDRGWIVVERESGPKHERLRLCLTPAGAEATQDFLRTPIPNPRVQSQAPARLLAARFIHADELAATFSAAANCAREGIADLQGQRRAYGRAYEHRNERLVIDLELALLIAYTEWTSRVAKELVPKPPRRSRRTV
jgi:DNA-binding PadR family transcriptional regulator